MAESLWHQRLYRWGLYITYFLFALTWLGLWSKAPEYLKLFESVLQMYVSFFLIINFSPVSSKAPLNEFSKGIAFGAGLLLFSNYVVKHLLYLQNYFNIGLPFKNNNYITNNNTGFSMSSLSDDFLSLRGYS